MYATAALAPAGPQCLRALERANQVRVARAELKREVARGGTDVAEVILHCPSEASGMPIADLLMSQHRWGEIRCRRLLMDLFLSERKTVGSLTDRQRGALVAKLIAAGMTPDGCAAQLSVSS
jgi:hypothetical protein